MPWRAGGTEPAIWRDRTSSVAPISRSALRLADADDGDEPGAPRGFRLGAHDGVGLAVVGAALGMADDDMRGAGVLQHLGRDVAGMRAAFLGVAVLAAGLDRRAATGSRRPASSSVAGTQISASVSASRPLMKPWPIGAQLVERGAGAVHLPVAGDQRADSWRHRRVSFAATAVDGALPTKIRPQSNRHWRGRALLPLRST